MVLAKILIISVQFYLEANPRSKCLAGRVNASGTDNFHGGVTWVGENGPELLWLPQGSRIDNAQESRMYGGDTFYITINADKIRELNDLIRMANDARRMQRMGGDK